MRRHARAVVLHGRHDRGSAGESGEARERGGVGGDRPRFPEQPFSRQDCQEAVVCPRWRRKSYRLSQSKFAALMGISPATLRNWEQGRRKPEGSARILLRIVARHPEAVLDVVSATSSRRRA
ncbi:MAG TPA: helix-turn-helix domain-containing protein [Thermoanaerobaculia bacterium]